MAETKTKINYKRVGLIIGLPLFIFIFNLILVGPLLSGQYSSFAYSDQPIYIKVSQFFKEAWPHIFWADFWTGGFSPPLVFSPLVPFFSVAASFFGLAAGNFLRIFNALAYAFIPVSLYFLVRRLTHRRVAAWLAAFAYSLLPSVMILFLPEIKEASRVYFFAPWHFINNLLGDTPRILSLALIPLVAVYFLSTLKNPAFKKIIICAALTLLVALVDFVSFFSLLILFIVLFFSEVLLSDRIAPSRLGIFLSVMIIAFGLFSFWYHPGYFNNFFRLGGIGAEASSDLLKIIPYLILVIPWLIIGLFYLFGYRKHLQSLFVSFAWFNLTFLVGFSYFFFGRSFLPGASHYLMEINMAFCLVIGVLTTHFFDWVGRIGGPKHRLANFFRYLFLFGALLVLVRYTLPFIRHAWQYNQPLAEINKEKIYQVSQWFQTKVKEGEGRVFLAGPGKNWFNLFNQRPQISGPLSESYYPNSLIYRLNKYWEGGPAEEGLALAKITNTEYFVVFPDFSYPKKFKNFGALVAEVEGVEIYQVKLTNSDLVQKITFEGFNDLEEINDSLKTEAIEKYLTWQEKLAPEKIEYRRVNNQKIIIRGNFLENEGILVKMNYSPAFKARQGDRELAVEKDPLGFMVIKPAKEGILEVELNYGLSLNQWIGFDITMLTLFFLSIYFFQSRRGKKTEKKINNSF